MIDNKFGNSQWIEWHDIVFDMFQNRLAAISEKEYLAITGNRLSSIFLQIKGFDLPASDIVPALNRLLNESEVYDSHYDNIAMMGHRIGMVENIAELKRYLQDAHKLLQPMGQILFTSINNLGKSPKPDQKRFQRSGSNVQLQQENLIGPFFSTFIIKNEILKSQAGIADWQYELICRQDDYNYLAKLGITESGC